MKIVYIDHYAGSPSLGMEYRPHAMALEWGKAGAETTILAGTFSHLRKVNFDSVKPGLPYEIDGVTFRFLPTRSYDGNGLGRVLSMGDFVLGGLRSAGRIARALNPDVVIASSTYPFDTWFAQSLAHQAHAVLVHEIHDLWPLTPIELGGHSSRHPLMLAMASAERSAYIHSDRIVSILPNAEEYVRSLGITTPVYAIPNGVVSDRDAREEAPSELVKLIDGIHDAGRSVIGYAGGLTTANAMDDFVRAMALLKDQPVTAILVGDGLYRDELERLAATVGADVRFFGSIPKTSVHDALTRFDALYIGSKQRDLYRFGVSANKIFDYMLTGVPVVNAFASKFSPLVEADCSIQADAEDAFSISQAILCSVHLDASERDRLGGRAIEWVKKKHSIPVLAEEFLSVLKNSVEDGVEVR